MTLRDFAEAIRWGQASTSAGFSIDPDRILGSGSNRDAGAFLPGKTYFEIRLSQMYLQYDREWWRTFIPLGSILTEFIFAGRLRTVPFVVGPDLLEIAPHITKDSRVEYQNIRVAGPYPYAGDQLQLFAGLFRVETGNWAKRALSMLEALAKAFDTTKLTSYVNIAAPLTDSLQGILGMQEVELRLGIERAYAQPTDQNTSGVLPRETLQPTFEVLLRLPAKDVTEIARRNFWVRDGRLFHGANEGALREFRDADFLLLHIIPLATRDDYTTFDFHKNDWLKVEDHLANGREKEAWERFRLLAANLSQCEDLIWPHRAALLAQYRSWFMERQQIYRSLLSEPGDFGFDSAPMPPQVTEPDLLSALKTESQGVPDTPEALLAQLDL
jgi:hypothetical protein